MTVLDTVTITQPGPRPAPQPCGSALIQDAVSSAAVIALIQAKQHARFGIPLLRLQDALARGAD
jgi:hypothetical protein